MKINFKKMSPLAQVPSYKTKGSAGADLYACLENINDVIIIKPTEIQLIPTKIILELPEGYEAQIRPRSGNALKGITIPNSPGTIDSDYRGELGVVIQNLGSENFEITHLMRIAQLVIAPVNQYDFIDIGSKEMSSTERGNSGFGSTGSH